MKQRSNNKEFAKKLQTLVIEKTCIVKGLKDIT